MVLFLTCVRSKPYTFSGYRCCFHTLFWQLSYEVRDCSQPRQLQGGGGPAPGVVGAGGEGMDTVVKRGRPRGRRKKARGAEGIVVKRGGITCCVANEEINVYISGGVFVRVWSRRRIHAYTTIRYEPRAWLE